MKYKGIAVEKKAELIEMIKIGINPESVSTEEEKEKVNHQIEMITYYFDEMAKLAISQQRQAIFDQKREKDIIKARLKILDDIDIKKPDVEIT